MAEVFTQLPKPTYLQAPGTDAVISYTAEDFRRHDGAMHHGENGVLSPGSFRVMQNTVVDWQVRVGNGWAILGGDAWEKYVVSNPAYSLIDLSTFNTSPAGTRTHRIWLAIYDHAYTGTLESTARLVAVEDTTGAGAGSPAGARTSMLLGNVYFNPGQSNIQAGNINTTIGYRALAYSGVTGLGSDVLSLTSGVIDASSVTNTSMLAGTIRNGMCYLTGSVKVNGSGWFHANTMYFLGTLNSDYAPRAIKGFACAGGPNLNTGTAAFSDFMYRLVVFPDGTVYANIPDGYAANYLYLDGAYWALDT